jgi:hypothetical protein
MSQLPLFDPTQANSGDPYAVSDEIGGALAPFVRFCKEQLGATEGEISLSLLLENTWKTGKHHPYLKAWDAYQRKAA